MFGQVARKGKLDEDAVHRGVVVSLCDFLKDLRLGDRFGKVDNLAENVRLYRCSGSVRLQRRMVGDYEIYIHTSSAAFNFMRTYVP
jgi:hypothetical protein